MKNKLGKYTVLLASLLLATACNNQEQSKEPSKPDTTSDVVVPSSQDPVPSSQDTTSSPKEDSSSEAPVPSSSTPVESSTPAPSSSEQSSAPSSSSEQPDVPFEYDSYLLKHASGSAEYIFEAECTNLSTKEGLGYSGTATESAMAVHDDTGANAFVTYLYKEGLSINYLIVCDRDINNAVLKARLGGEFMHVELDPSNYSFRVDTIVTKDDLDEAIGNWDAAFLDYYTDLSETGGYYIDPWDCGSIDINAVGSSDPTNFDVFQITSKLRLKKGINCISLITMNSDSPGMGTMGAIAPVVDYISITTDANLGMYDVNDNGEGTVGVHFKA